MPASRRNEEVIPISRWQKRKKVLWCIVRAGVWIDGVLAAIIGLYALWKHLF